MPTPFQTAKHAYENLRDKFYPDAEVTIPSGEKMQYAGIALHSETLAPFVIMTDPARRAWRAAAAGAVRQTGPSGTFDASDIADLRRYRHKKGGDYTRLGTVEHSQGNLVIYVSHMPDHVWWIRPEEMFEDGRFEVMEDITPLDRDALQI